MASVVVVGAGLAGLAATAVLADSGFEVDVFEARPYPGGRATSYAVVETDGRLEIIDNCQHILLRCCTNLLDFYRRLASPAKLHSTENFTGSSAVGARLRSERANSLRRPISRERFCDSSF